MGVTNEIKAGYKKTKLGWIPEEWKIVKLGTVTSKVGSGSTPRGGEKVYVSKGVPFIRSQNVNANRLLISKLSFIPLEIHEKMSGSKVIGNDILLNITGASIGRSCVVPSNFKEGNVNQHVCIIRLIETGSIKFIQLFLSSFSGQKSIIRSQVGGNREGLNFQNVRSLKIPLPPLPEQKKIADILSTWDKAIDTTQALIKKLQLRKKGLMQQLLTGKNRLPGFSGEWRKVRLGEVGSFLKGKGIPKKELVEKGVPCIRYGELYTVHHSVVKEFHSFINEESSKQSVELNYGDILFACSGETLNEIGKSAAFVSNKRAYAGGDIVILRQDDHSPYYLGFLFDTNDFIRKRRKYGQGQSVLHIYKSGLEKIAIKIPAIEEQTAIAQVLTKADEGIHQTQNYLEQLQEQKKGLMQQLLTGQRRVVV